MEQIILSLGSNQGNRLEYLKQAIKELLKCTTGACISSVYSTEPQDFKQQADFLNLVYVAQYNKDAEDLLEKTQSIEYKLGRHRHKAIPKGPRTIDIDILAFGEHVIQTNTLIVPHPAMKKRQFVLIPLLEVLPNYAEPITKIPYKTYLEQLEDQGVQKYCSVRELNLEGFSIEEYTYGSECR